MDTHEMEKNGERPTVESADTENANRNREECSHDTDDSRAIAVREEDFFNLKYDEKDNGEDDEEVKRIRAEWKKRNRIKRLTPLNSLLMLGVIAFVPWYIYGDRQDIAYFFSSSEPVDLGRADAYSMGIDAEKPEYPNNRYVRIQGIPIRQVGIQMRDTPLAGNVVKLVYQLMGSPIYIEENAKDSKYAEFISKTTTSFRPDAAIDPVDITGRLRRFDSGDETKYIPVRNYYSEKYGTQFCENMAPTERKRKAALLGQGGVSVQIMPDGSVIQADTKTHDTLIDVEPLRGRSAIAIGQNNTLLHTIDAGLSWRKTQWNGEANLKALAFDAASQRVLFGGSNGWTGSEQGDGDGNALRLSQDIRDLVFTNPPPEDSEAPRIIAVGREGLLQVAYPNREGWVPATIENHLRFNDILRVGNSWFAAGSNDTLMYRNDETGDSQSEWISSVSPVRAQWLSLTQVPGFVVATGTNGAIARLPIRADGHPIDSLPSWQIWKSDDVPGIEFDAEIRASAVSDDGKTWVGVGSQGNIVVAQAKDDGVWGEVRRISGRYSAYGFLDDFANGWTAEAALGATLNRSTDEDLNDVAYYHGTFYAVGTNSTLLISSDGHHWQKRPLHIKGKTLRAITFTQDGTGVIGGEKGTLLTTTDEGKTWKSKVAPTERSIYAIESSPQYKNGFVFAGAYGLWGLCETTNDGRCYLRSRTADFHYRSIAFAPGEQKTGYLHVVAAGDNAHIDRIDDAPQSTARVTPLLTPTSSSVYALALADDELPLKPDAPRGQVDLIAVGNAVMLRSYDGGYTFKPEQMGVQTPMKRLAMTKSGSVAWAFDGLGNALADEDARRLWAPIDPTHKRHYIDGYIWENLDPGRDSVLGKRIARTGILIDETCLYRKILFPSPKSPKNSPEKKIDADMPAPQTVANDAEPIACLTDKSLQLRMMAIDYAQEKLVVAMQHIPPKNKFPNDTATTNPMAEALFLTEFSIRDLWSQTPENAKFHSKMGDVLNEPSNSLPNSTENLPPEKALVDNSNAISPSKSLLPITPTTTLRAPSLDFYRLLACQSERALIDDTTHTLIHADGTTQTHVADASCIDNKIVRLHYERTAPNAYRLTARHEDSDLWTIPLGIDPQNARFNRNAAGRWWIAVPTDNATLPFILMSNDGKSWSWRRDRITDFTAVASAQNYAVAVGESGTILVSENYGKTWNTISTATPKTLRDVCISSDGSFAIAVGDAGTIYRSKNNLQRWTKLKYKLDIDLTSCAIVEQKDRFQSYIAGKGGAIYTTLDPEFGKLDLIPSPAIEDIYSLAALETGEVLAVGGVYQDPDTICEEGYLVEANEKPIHRWPSIIIALLLIAFWIWTLKTFIISFKHRHDFDNEDA